MTQTAENQVTTASEPKERRGLRLYESNPFLSVAAGNTKHGVKRITAEGGDKMMIVNGGTGEIIAPAGFWQIQEVDKTQFVKLYINGVKAFKGLSNAGTRVFEQMYLQIQNAIGKDQIIMAWHAVDQAVSPISKSTYSRGLRELVDKGFLAASMVPSIFFINPDYIWNGDRLAFVKEYRKIATKPQAKPELERDTKTIDMFQESPSGS